MKTSVQLTNKIAPIRNSLNRSFFWQCGFVLIPLVITVACLALLPQARATCQNGCLNPDSTALGESALASNFGEGNTAVGSDALAVNTSGAGNTAVGQDALSDNNGSVNVAVGGLALQFNMAGGNNTAIGYAALRNNSAASFNTGTGAGALQYNTTGQNNTANGYEALYGVPNSSTGGNNTATGYLTLYSNTTGYSNTAAGVQALYNNTTGNQNTAQGYGALSSNTTGINNTSEGLQALYSNTTGFSNTAVGLTALSSNTTGGSNIALGSSAGVNLTTGSNNIDIGNGGVAAESNTIRIGTSGTQTATFIGGIRGVAVAGGQPVAVNATGQLGIRASSARFKENIRPMDKASEAILSLQPVTFRYRKELDPKGAAQFGLVAEEVAKTSPDLVVCDDQGKPFTVRYEEVNAMLLNEFLKEHRKVEDQARINQQQEATIARLETALKEQAAQIQKVNARLAADEAAPRLVVNDP